MFFLSKSSLHLKEFILKICQYKISLGKKLLAPTVATVYQQFDPSYSGNVQGPGGVTVKKTTIYVLDHWCLWWTHDSRPMQHECRKPWWLYISSNRVFNMLWYVSIPFNSLALILLVKMATSTHLSMKGVDMVFVISGKIKVG